MSEKIQTADVVACTGFEVSSGFRQDGCYILALTLKSGRKTIGKQTGFEVALARQLVEALQEKIAEAEHFSKAPRN